MVPLYVIIIYVVRACKNILIWSVKSVKKCKFINKIIMIKTICSLLTKQAQMGKNYSYMACFDSSNSRQFVFSQATSSFS